MITGTKRALGVYFSVASNPRIVMAQNGPNFILDEAVIAKLPGGTKVISAESYGESAWSVTARINCIDRDGSAIRFFVKFVSGDTGKAQLEGEYYAMSELYRTMPTHVPKPQGWGRLSVPLPSATETHFFLCEFVNISNALPDPAGLAAVITDLHKKSSSPTGKFGFHITTFDGKLPQVVNWDNSWASFFGKLLDGTAALDVKTNGPSEELAEVVGRTLSHVIPRLLGALESDGRSVRPCLIHGDLWEGNIGTEFGSGNIYIFDSCAYYAHHEMEIGIWRVEHHRMKAKAYTREYLRRVDPSEPVDEFDDRNRLYNVKTKLMWSALVAGTNVRHQAIGDLRYLINKYAPYTENGKDEKASSYIEVA